MVRVDGVHIILCTTLILLVTPDPLPREREREREADELITHRAATTTHRRLLLLSRIPNQREFNLKHHD
jgi:hypothetical protein